MTKKTTLALALPMLFATACGRGPELETRTFAVHHLAPNEVAALIEPYVYADRPTQPGRMSPGERAVTVRETPDNLDRIERVLAQFDEARPDLRLTFQVIEADGFTDVDPRISAVEEQLKKLFQFKGYRLVGDAVVTVTDGGDIQQSLSGGGDDYTVQSNVYWAAGGTAQLDRIRLWNGDHEAIFQTSVAIRPGQTLVLGTTPKKGSAATLLLTLHAEAVEG